VTCRSKTTEKEADDIYEKQGLKLPPVAPNVV